MDANKINEMVNYACEGAYWRRERYEWLLVGSSSLKIKRRVGPQAFSGFSFFDLRRFFVPYTSTLSFLIFDLNEGMERLRDNQTCAHKLKVVSLL